MGTKVEYRKYFPGVPSNNYYVTATPSDVVTLQYQPEQFEQYSEQPQEFGQTLMCEFPVQSCSQIGGQLVQLRVLEQPQQVEGKSKS